MKKTFFIIGAIVVIIIIVIIVFCVAKKKGSEGPLIAEEIYGLSGVIKEIRDNFLVVEANILLADPKEAPIKKMVNITVTDETELLKLKFPEKLLKGSTVPVFPEETEINLSELKAGDKIDIRTVDNISENIENKTEIVADTINLVE